jgi:phage gp45-like
MSYNNMPGITPTHTAVTVGNTSTAVAVANPHRKYLLLVNDSDEVIYIKLGAAAVLNQGIRINASGGSYEMTVQAGNLYVGAINGICASGSKIMLVTDAVGA